RDAAPAPQCRRGRRQACRLLPAPRDGASMSEQLERRYERLLALFPEAYRREYEDEMIGVLMARAKPQQRFPGLREAANLIGCAVWMRLGGRGTGSADARWTQGAAAYGLLASML